MIKTALRYGLVGTIYQSVIADKVIPVPGSIVYCDIITGVAEHSGIYVGDNRIIHLNGNGEVEAVSPKTFMNRLDGFNTAANIYVSSRNGKAVGSRVIAERALKQLESSVEYNLILDNCHRFVGGCITGDFNTYYSFLWAVKAQAEITLEAEFWLRWDL